MNERKKLSDILQQSGDREHLSRLWAVTAAAEERGPLPPGEYTFRILSGELFNSKGGTPGYKLTLEVVEGECEGRRAWADFWLTRDAMPMTKRDLEKIGLTTLEQLEKPLPAGILIRGKLALRRDDDGTERNRFVRFEYAGVEPGDAFEPKDPGDDQAEDGPDNGDPDGFPFGANGKHGNGTAAPDGNGTPAQLPDKPAASKGKGKTATREEGKP